MNKAVHAPLNRDENGVNRAESEQFIELAQFLFPLDLEKGVAGLMRSTPKRVRRILALQAPAHLYAMERMRALVDELERLDVAIEPDCTGAIIVKAAGVGPGDTINTGRWPLDGLRNRYPWKELMPGDWFWVGGLTAGARNVWISCQTQNRLAGRRIWTYQHLLGGTRVDRLP